MPELPEVETTIRNLAHAGAVGLRIKDATVNWQRTVQSSPTEFRGAVVGQTIKNLGRRGKYIILNLDNGSSAVVHLRMSGRLNLVERQTERTGYERVVLTLSDGRELRFHDPRKFGRFIITANAERMLSHLAREPFADDFSAQYVQKYLKAHARQLKPLLLDQTALVAGIGNIYADEALWRAQIHPQTLSNALNRPSATRLHSAIVAVLQDGIKNFGTSLGTGQANFKLPANKRARNQEKLQIFRRTGEPCYNCQTTIKRIIVGQRATHICPHCQILSTRA